MEIDYISVIILHLFYILFFFRNDVSGMTKKAFPNVQKLATVYCCARETLEKLSNPGEAQDEAQDDKDPGVAFTVEKVDVEAAFDVMKQSMQTFKSFKVMLFSLRIFKLLFDNNCFQTSLGKELGEVDDEKVNQVNSEDLILGAAQKIRKLYANMDADKKVCAHKKLRILLFIAIIIDSALYRQAQPLLPC